MVKHFIEQPAQLTLPRLRLNKKQDLVARLALSNRILAAEPVPDSQAVAPNRYQLRVNVVVPGQWTRSEIEAVLEITQDWCWRGIFDLKRLREIEELLDAVASRGGAE